MAGKGRRGSADLSIGERSERKRVIGSPGCLYGELERAAQLRTSTRGRHTKPSK